MAKPILYGTIESPPVRAVLLTAKAIGLELELKKVNSVKGENLTDEYIKKNPQHTIPTLEDDGAIIWDSHAICTYLIGKYARGDNSLYPQDLLMRARIDQRLHFDTGILFAQLRNALMPILYWDDKKGISEEKRAGIEGAYNFLERFLNEAKYLVDDALTVADLCALPTVSSLSILVPIEEEKYPNISRWLVTMEALPYFSINKEGNDFLETAYVAKLGA